MEEMMTPTERECRVEWIEAAIRWHQEQIIAHRDADAEADLNRLHTVLCRAARQWRPVSMWDESGIVLLLRSAS
jgi:hypothetical protein